MYFGLVMYTTYDTLLDNPIKLVVAELLFLGDENPDWVSTFVKATVMSWSRFHDYSPSPHRPRAMWLMKELFEDVFAAQEERRFTPKTFTELTIGMLVGLFRLGVATFDACVAIAAATWRKAGPTVTKTAFTLSWLAWTGILVALDSADAWKKNHDLSFTSLFVSVLSIPFQIWNLLRLVYAYCVLWCWVRVMDPSIRFEGYIETATFWDQREALMNMTRMSIWDMAGVMIERNQLKKQIVELKPVMLEEARLEVEDMINELAARTISWRTSHIEMLYDYNHCRRTLDGVMHVLMSTVMGLDPWSGTRGRSMFDSAALLITNDPEPSGLHYKTSIQTFPCVNPEQRSACERDMGHMLYKLTRGVSIGDQYYVPTMDLYNDETWVFDITKIGFRWAECGSDRKPYDFQNRVAYADKVCEIEDYAIDGRLFEWYRDLAAKRDEQEKRKKIQPLFRTYRATGHGRLYI
jgi:hypothetical protein